MSELPREGHDPTTSLRATLLLALVVAPLGLLVWRGVLELTLLGWDTYPLIATARVEGLGELWGSLGRELMDGRYPLGHYWRPVTQLSFAIDHALFGLEPRGYLATGVAILVLSGTFVARIVFAWPTPGFPSPGYRRRALVGALAAGLAWTLHGAQFEVLTVPARRADALAVMWTLWAVLLQLGRWSPRRSIAVGVLCALALGSKETGAVAIPLLLLLGWFQAAHLPGERRLGARLVGLLRRSGAVCVAGVGMVTLRFLVLGGAGGGEASSLALDPSRALSVAGSYLRLVVDPPSVAGSAALGSTAGGWFVDGPWNALTWVLPVVLLLLAWLHRNDAHPEGRTLSTLPSATFLALWWFGLAAVTSTSGLVEGWYAVPFLAPFAVGTGWMVRTALTPIVDEERARAAPTPGARWLGLPVIVLVAVLLARNATGAGVGQALADHHRVSLETERLLDELNRKLETARPGSSVSLSASFEWARVDAEGKLVRKILPLGPYSLEAYAELRFPDRGVFVRTVNDPDPREPGSDEVRVVVRAVPRLLED